MNMMANFAVTLDTKGQNEYAEGDVFADKHLGRVVG